MSTRVIRIASKRAIALIGKEEQPSVCDNIEANIRRAYSGEAETQIQARTRDAMNARLRSRG